MRHAVCKKSVLFFLIFCLLFTSLSLIQGSPADSGDPQLTAVNSPSMSAARSRAGKNVFSGIDCNAATWEIFTVSSRFAARPLPGLKTARDGFSVLPCLPVSILVLLFYLKSAAALSIERQQAKITSFLHETDGMK